MFDVYFNSSCFTSTASKPITSLAPAITSSSPDSTPSTSKIVSTAPKYTTEDFNRQSTIAETAYEIISSTKNALATEGTSHCAGHTDELTTEDMYTMSSSVDEGDASALTTHTFQDDISPLYTTLGSVALTLLLVGVGAGVIAYLYRARRARSLGPIYRRGSPRGWRSPLEGTTNPNASLEDPFALEMGIIEDAGIDDESEI